MNNRSKPMTTANIGSSSMLVVFIILCLVTFATLSFVSSHNDLQFTQTVAERTTSYYAAVSEAQRQLSEIDAALISAQTPKDALQALKSVSVTEEAGVLYGEFFVKINDRQALSVMVKVPQHVAPPPSAAPEKTATARYTIIRWQEVSTTTWVGDNQVKLISPTL